MSVLAEGIESEDQLALLTETGCDDVQGCLFGRPKSLEDLIACGEITQISPATDLAAGDQLTPSGGRSAAETIPSSN